jgi:DNA-binding NarL/FixJ family response regulator
VRIRIIIADDHKILRQGLKTLLEKEPDMEVVAEAGDGEETVTMVRELVPDVVVMDPKMPIMDGTEATRQILSELPAIKVIGLSMYYDRHFVTNMLKAGARGYLPKDCAFEELAQAIRLVFSDKCYLSPGIADVVVKDYVTLDSNPSHSASSMLTAREQEVMQLMVEGKRPSQIADLLDISAKTVDTHRGQIMRSLGIESVAELTKYAIREGLTSLEA